MSAKYLNTENIQRLVGVKLSDLKNNMMLFVSLIIVIVHYNLKNGKKLQHKKSYGVTGF